MIRRTINQGAHIHQKVLVSSEPLPPSCLFLLLICSNAFVVKDHTIISITPPRSQKIVSCSPSLTLLGPHPVNSTSSQNLQLLLSTWSPLSSPSCGCYRHRLLPGSLQVTTLSVVSLPLVHPLHSSVTSENANLSVSLTFLLK